MSVDFESPEEAVVLGSLPSSRDAPAGAWRAWLTVGLLWLVACADFLTRNMIAPMHGSLKQAIPMTEAQFGLLTAAYLCTYGVLSPFAGFLSDRFSRSRVIALAMIGWSALTWMTAGATNFNELLVLRALVGATQACYIPAGLALIADYHRGSTRALATGLHHTGLVAGAMLGGLGGWLAEARSWTFAFWVVGLPGVIYGALLLVWLRDARRSTPVAASPAAARFVPAMASLFGRGSYILTVVCVALIGGSGMIFMGWLPIYLGEHFGLSQGAAGFSATGYINAAGAAGLVVGGAWSDRWARTTPRSRIYVAALGIALAVPAMLLVAKTSSLAAAVVGLLLTGFLRSFLDANVLSMICMVSDARYRATGYGVMNAIACITGGLVIYLGGKFRDRGGDLAVIFTVVALLQIFFAALILRIRLHSPAAKA